MYVDDTALLFKYKSKGTLKNRQFYTLHTSASTKCTNTYKFNQEFVFFLYYSNPTTLDTEPLIVKNYFKLPFDTESKYPGMNFDNNVSCFP